MGLALGVPGVSAAAEGPWTTPKGLHEIYLGGGMEHFQEFDTGGGDTSEVPYRVYRAGGKLFWRYGFHRNMDVAFDVPYLTAYAPDAPEDNGTFAQSTNIEYLKTRLRVRLPSEGLPVELAARAELRTGYLHRESRGRITNLGEGTTDIGATLSAGKMGLFGDFFYTFALDVGYWYRFPLETGADGKVPGDEVLVSSFLQFTPAERFGIAVFTDSFWRLTGGDIGDVDVDDSDNVWAAIRAAQTKVGGQLVLYPSTPWPQLTLSVSRAVWARNNPVDTTMFEVGVGFNLGTMQ